MASSGDEILEGFLCPICMQDLRTPIQLSAHFEEFHAEEKEFVQQLRSVFGKVKQKITRKDDPVQSQIEFDTGQSSNYFVSKGTPGSGGIDLGLWDLQVLGASKSHTKIFRNQRKVKIERYVVETNKIIIRLKKLVNSGLYNSDSSLPAALKVRKDIERSVVPWESDSDVKYCPNCSKKFSMLYRKHHCRVCGKVICQPCSDFINIALACEILDQDCTAFINTPKNSDLDEDKNGFAKNGIRCCQLCLDLLLRHNKLSKEKQNNPDIIRLYETMKQYMVEADSLQPRFVRMADCINAGETEYSLESTFETRTRLLKTYETIEAISKKIQFLGTDAEKPPHPRVLKLQRSIRSFATNFLSDNMFTLPGLPTLEKYAELRNRRDFEQARRRREENLIVERLSTASSVGQLSVATQKAVGNAKTSKSDDDSGPSEDDTKSGFFKTDSIRSKFKRKDVKQNNFNSVSITKNSNVGWGPVQVTLGSSPDPMVQQMEIIKGYIIQARQDKRYDEVRLFEQNLKELELEYMRLRQQR